MDSSEAIVTETLSTRDKPRGLAKSYGERLRNCNARNLSPEKAEALLMEGDYTNLPLNGRHGRDF